MLTQNSKIVLNNFCSIAPKNKKDQASALEWLASAHAQAEIGIQANLSEEDKAALSQKIKKLVIRLGRANDRIKFRSSPLDDFMHLDWRKMRLFNLEAQPSGAGCSEKSTFFSEVAQDAFRRFYAEEAVAPSTLIHVTCTGYVAPSGAQFLVAEKNWGTQTEVLHAYHMGCYGAFPAIRMAWGALSRRGGRSDIVHTELCSLHLDPTQHTIEQIMIQSLFSDGMIRYSAHDLEEFNCFEDRDPALEVVALQEEILPTSERDMTWMAATHGMQMGISREVPNRITSALPSFLSRLAKTGNMDLSHLQKTAIFAIHPGGPKIVDHIQSLLELSDDQVAPSNAVLESFGNMSSATLPHVWKTIVEDQKIQSGTPVVSLAFGPGLTVSGAVMRKIQ